MARLLIPDAGPLFSLAAGGLLDVLLNFRLLITDVVKMETIDKGGYPSSSFEANRLSAFYAEHKDGIWIAATQLGHLIELADGPSSNASSRQAGELSIQGFLIQLAANLDIAGATVLFEDRWLFGMPAVFRLLRS